MKDELHHAAVRAAQVMQQFARGEPRRAHDQHPHTRAYLPDVEQNVIDCPMAYRANKPSTCRIPQQLAAVDI